MTLKEPMLLAGFSRTLVFPLSQNPVSKYWEDAVRSLTCSCLPGFHGEKCCNSYSKIHREMHIWRCSLPSGSSKKEGLTPLQQLYYTDSNSPPTSTSGQFRRGTCEAALLGGNFLQSFKSKYWTRLRTILLSVSLNPSDKLLCLTLSRDKKDSAKDLWCLTPPLSCCSLSADFKNEVSAVARAWFWDRNVVVYFRTKETEAIPSA